MIIGQEDAFPSHLVHKRLDLGVLEFDDLLLPAVDPTGEYQEEKLPGAEDETHDPVDTGYGPDLRIISQTSGELLLR